MRRVEHEGEVYFVNRAGTVLHAHLGEMGAYRWPPNAVARAVLQRDRIEQLKAARRKLSTPIERVAFDNNPANGPIGLRIIAMTEV